MESTPCARPQRGGKPPSAPTAHTDIGLLRSPRQDGHAPVSAGSLRLPAVKHGGAAPQPALRRGCYAHTTTGMYMPERGRPAGLSLSDLAFSLSGGEISKNIYPAHYMDI